MGHWNKEDESMSRWNKRMSLMTTFSWSYCHSGASGASWSQSTKIKENIRAESWVLVSSANSYNKWLLAVPVRGRGTFITFQRSNPGPGGPRGTFSIFIASQKRNPSPGSPKRNVHYVLGQEPPPRFPLSALAIIMVETCSFRSRRWSSIFFFFFYQELLWCLASSGIPDRVVFTLWTSW